MGFHISNGVLEKYTEEEGVTEAVIPYKVKSIGGEAFYGCTNLKSVTIPLSLIHIYLFLYLDIARNFVFTASNYFFDFTDQIFIAHTKRDVYKRQVCIVYHTATVL